MCALVYPCARTERFNTFALFFFLIFYFIYTNKNTLLHAAPCMWSEAERTNKKLAGRRKKTRAKWLAAILKSDTLNKKIAATRLGECFF
jgi:hypothetical protein